MSKYGKMIANTIQIRKAYSKSKTLLGKRKRNYETQNKIFEKFNLSRSKFSETTLSLIDKLLTKDIIYEKRNGDLLEQVSSVILQKLNYVCTIKGANTSHTVGDGGIDIQAFRNEEEKIAVYAQCKNHVNPIAPKDIKELIGTASIHDSKFKKELLFITTSYYTADAVETIEKFNAIHSKTKIVCYDFKWLIEQIELHKISFDVIKTIYH